MKHAKEGSIKILPNSLKTFPITLYYIVLGMFFLTFSSCEESELTGEEMNTTLSDINREERTYGLDEKTNGPSTPYPTIIHQTFVPDYYMFDHTKCLTWRISWPEYENGYDQDLIPTVISLPEGNLNSFNYLNQNTAIHTYQATFSLYYENTLETAINMWMQLDHAGIGNGMTYTKFQKVNKSVKSIEYMVKERPGLFEVYWDYPGEEKVSYQAGDFFLFKIEELDEEAANLYGGVRIVSMSPRIIEVYLAVPNDAHARPEIGSTIFK